MVRPINVHFMSAHFMSEHFMRLMRKRLMRGFGISIGNAIVLAMASSALFAVTPSKAADLQWGGLYRFEGNLINNPELSSSPRAKTYMLHHLILQPKIVAADGMTVFGRFDLLNSNFGTNSQAGAFIGQGVGTGTPSSIDNSNVLSRNQTISNLQITELYMSWTQEFGQLVVGRAPLNFGLGVWFNSGRGNFDHYLSTLDMVGYKVVTGNLFIMPILGKVNEGSVDQEDDVNDYMVHAQYDNPETELSIGLLYQTRVAGSNDIVTGTDYVGGTGATRVGGYKHSYIGVFSSQKLKDFTVAVEAGILSGDIGVRTVGGSDVKLNAFGLAAEVAWKPENSKWSSVVKAGFATGDDPGTLDTNEGFTFSRNYRVGQLLFTHPLGQRDFFRTGLTRDVTPGSTANQIDTESISNAMYLAPAVQFRSSDTWAFGGTFILGRLNKEPIAGGSTATDLGYEIDLNMTWTPFDRFSWVTEVGMLLPGQTWKAGPANLDNSFAYGITTKAAVRF